MSRFSSVFVRFKKAVLTIAKYLLTLMRWSALGVLCGLVCGAAGAAFWYILHFAAETLTAYPLHLFLLPAAGLLIIALYRACGLANNKGTNEIIDAVRNRRSLSPLVAPLVFIGTFFTHLCGGSAGKEGAALQIGGSLGSLLGRIFRLGAGDSRILVLCGMAGVFAGVFGTPITAIMFVIEFVCVGVIYHAALFPGLVCCFTASKLSAFLGVAPVSFTLSTLPDTGALTYVKVAALAAICALVSMIFCYVSEGAAELFSKIKNSYLRVAVGGGIIVLLTLIVGNRDYNGTGMALVEHVFAGGTVFVGAFALKLLFTAITMNSGFKGGEIVPTFCIGATLGAVLAPVMGLPATYGAAIGLVSLFCGVTNAPIASIFLSIELFGGVRVAHFALACILSFALSGSASLYSSQRFAYDKLTARLIHTPKE